MESAKRLIITEMLLENFKSYAGAQKVGPFHKCFSSVVGPNGSGKSNVIDAMLFVFGKRAKQLRLNKVSELIHNSTHHQNLEMAKVSIFFQEIVDTGEESFELVPNSDFTVSRTAHCNNTSNYYIGSRKSNFSEVTDLLKGKGIDLDNNRFLILQGEVEQISMMKPKALTPHETGLLEYLEDIIGTHNYVEHIEAGAKRLEEMNDARQGLVQRLKITEREKDSLEDARIAAEAYMDKERECTEAQCTIYQMHVMDGTRNIGIIEKSLGELDAKLKYENGKMQGYAADLDVAESKYKADSKVHANIQSELDKSDEAMKGFERKDIKLREDMKHSKGKLKKLTDKIAKDAKKAEEASLKADSAEADVPKLAAKVVELAQTLQTEEQSLEAMQDSVKGEEESLQKALQEVREKLAPWEKKIAGAQSKLNIVTGERDLLVQQQSDAEQRLKDAQNGLTEAKEAEAQKTSEIADMQKAVKTHKTEAASARREADTAASEVARLEAGLREVRGKLEQRRNDSNSQNSQSAIVQALMKAKASGQIPGIYGRLGDLGAIDKQYDVAVSTACGALDNIVVEDTAAAQKCLELLRKGSLGVATCLMLDKQAHLARSACEKVSTPEGVKRLFDLVKVPDQALRCAWYYALGNTLVANDLQQASRIAYGSDKRFSRVVTLKGELINETGTMTGGGGKPRGGRMCLGNAAPKGLDTQQAAAELADAETEFTVSKQRLEETRSKAESATKAAEKAEQQIAALEVQIPKSEMEVAAQRQRAQDLQERLSELQNATKVGAEEVRKLKDLESAVKSAAKELQKLQESASGLHAQAEQLQQQISDVGGEPLKKKKANVKRLHEAIAETEEESARKKVEAESARKQVDKLRKEEGKALKEKVKAESDIEGLTASLTELEDAAMKVLEDQAKIKALLEEKSAELAVIKEEYETKKKEVNIIRNVEVELQNKISDLRVSFDFETGARNSNRKRADAVRKKLAEMAGTPDKLPDLLTEEAMSKLVISDLEFRVTVLEEELGRMSPDLSAIEAYRKKEADYKSRAQELETATADRDEVRKAYEDLRKRRLDDFMAGFNVISLKLKEMYQMITLGGDAELELVDSLDPFSEGIVFSVRPPNKSWKNIANLSGGEKTLSSLSLVFALHHYKPTPLYVMDEIDAALDFKNVSIVAHYIKDRTKNAQFIIISLRNNMFELADRLVGIYKTDNATKSVAINPGEFAVGKTSSANFKIGLAAA